MFTSSKSKVAINNNDEIFCREVGDNLCLFCIWSVSPNHCCGSHCPSQTAVSVLKANQGVCCKVCMK